MGQRVSRTDFEWVYTDEPHATRRKQILAKYPKIKELMGHDPWLKWAILLIVAIQLVSVYFVRNLPWSYVIVLAYLFGGTLNHSLQLAMHEVAHNLAFGHKRPMANRIMGMICNLPIGVPASISFKKYHMDHHKYQGDDVMDTDIPSYPETVLFRHTGTKILWVFLQPFFYAFRPLLVFPKPVTSLELVNGLVQLTFDGLLLYFAGLKGFAYLLAGSILAMGMHPVAGHFVSEHYMFVKGFETYSYYGPLNWLCFNVGYHNEHHDFPNIPGRLLPKVREYAPEFYDDLPCHTSWVRVLWDFITDPAMGPHARVKRPSRFGGAPLEPDPVYGEPTPQTTRYRANAAGSAGAD